MREFLSTPEQFSSDQGFSLIEMIATCMIIGIVSMIAINRLQDLDNPVLNATSEMTGFFKQVRARAISTTSAYKISATSNTEIITEYGETCADIDTADDKMILELPNGASMTTNDWEICYNSRGLPDDNIQITVTGASGTRTLEVYLGGAVKEI